MNILLLNTSDSGGGAAVASSRLLKALGKAGKEVTMLVRDKRTQNSNIISVNTSWFQSKINYLRFLLERLIIFCCNSFNKNNLFKVSIANTGVNITKNKLIINADIINLHWINQGFLSLKDIKKLLLLNKPVVWTLHDMWPCTGICHHAWTCNKFMQECGECPFLHSNKMYDLSYKVWNRKKFVMSSNIHIVVVSSWLANRVKQSSLMCNLPVTIIPNAIDTSVFYKREKTSLRRTLHLPLNKKIILMGAARLDDPIKGFEYLKKALRLLSEENGRNSNLMLVLFGAIKDKINFFEDLSIPYTSIGVLKDLNQIADLYSAADVVVVPSLYETFGQTIIESMACGCPAVSFNNSGQTDIIDHKINGYLAKYLDVTDFAEGIDWVLNRSNSEDISFSCVKKVQTNYTENIVAKKYISLYKDILKK